MNIKYIYAFLFIFLFILTVLIIFKIIFGLHLLSKKNKLIIIEVDIYGSKQGTTGPSTFNKGMREVLPYSNKNCSFISSKKITLNNLNHKSDYYYISLPFLSEEDYDNWVKANKTNKLIIGPNFVPLNWFTFPSNNWKERRFPEILKSLKKYVVHTNRVRNHLMRRSNTTHMIKKFINLRPCTNLIPKKISTFDERKVDIIFFEKYADLNRTNQGNQLYELFKNTSMNVQKITYGFYTKSQMKKLANNSKFLIYYSFYDCGPIGLIEIQNYGVYFFTHQKELILDSKTGFYVPELANKDNMKIPYQIILKKIDILVKSGIKSEIIAKINQNNNICQRTLDDLCEGIIS